MIYSIGPEETSIRVVMLKLLMAVEKGGLHKLEIPMLHRSMGRVGKAIEHWEKRSVEEAKDIPISVRSASSAFDCKNDGLYIVLDEFLKDLALFGVVTLESGENGEYMRFASDARQLLKETLGRLCEIHKDEEPYFDALAKVGVDFYRKLTTNSCCD
ncbi:hypothetical protein KW796_00250 [Candidatus Parcubacteria bacterium]|nr:hypothetical protein [Candidatus Parcubacteria bacterium]